MRYELIEHTADFGIRVFGDTAKALFENAANALFEVLTDRSRLQAGPREHLVVTGADWEDLLINWFRELLYLWNGRELLLVEASIQTIGEYRIEARLDLARYEPDQHVIHADIKAVTYHQAEVKSDSAGWMGQAIFDV
jgi:SHS2 domain-containing protein